MEKCTCIRSQLDLLKAVNIKLYKQEEENHVSETRDERASFWTMMQIHPENIPVE
jgi:hypothetical protein